MSLIHRLPLLIIGACYLVTLVVNTGRAEGPRNISFIAPTEALPAEEQQKKFHLPPGFAIQLVAAEPDIRKPINLNFDARGRLYATQSEEYPFPAADGAPHRDVVKRFNDIGPDGIPAHVYTAAKNLNIPIGVLPRDDGLIYYSIPNIFRASDIDQEGCYRPGKALYGPFGYQDTHGMGSSFTRWIDGWVYACHGHANESELQGTDGHTVSMSSGNTFRFRADGSRVEQFTHGQVNPFGLAFDPLGNLYSADCHTKPLYMLLHGAWYPGFGKSHDGLGYGPEMITHLHGSTGIAGVVYYSAAHFPAEYRDTIFLGNPVTGRVNHDQLEPHGSTYKAIARSDFLSCDDPWFRPVDLKLGPDGAIYIADFYNRIIAHDEVPHTHPQRDRSLGRIWRVVYTGEDHAPQKALQAAENLTQLTCEQLVAKLGDPNLTVRVLAAEQLEMSPAASEVVDQLSAAIVAPTDDEAMSHRKACALWLIEHRSPGGLTDKQIERLATDLSREVRVHLQKALAERSDWSSKSVDLFRLTRDNLHDVDAFVVRAAASALGQHPHVDNVEPLLSAWAATPADDTHLIHTVRMALRNQLLVPGMYSQLTELVAHDANAADRIADVSLGARTSDAAAYLLRYVDGGHFDQDRLANYLHDIVRYCTEDCFEGAVRRVMTLATAPADQQQVVLLAVTRAAQERGRELPNEIVDRGRCLFNELLASPDKMATKKAIELASELRFKGSYEQLAALAERESPHSDLRLAAIDACLTNDKAKAIPMLNAIVADASDAIAVRQKAATALAHLREPEVQRTLLEQLRQVPDRLAIEIARGLALDAMGSEILIEEIKCGRASPRLLTDSLVKMRMSHHEALLDEMSRIASSLPSADSQIAKLIKARRDGLAKATIDLDAGHQVFIKSCGICHKIGDEGVKIGPELHGIGLRGVDRLLEDILDPSRNVDQAFRSTQIETTDGQILTGLLLREDGNIVVLANTQGIEVRLPATNVIDRSVSNLSPMPANVAEQMSEADFYNLLAFLLEQKQLDEKLRRESP